MNEQRQQRVAERLLRHDPRVMSVRWPLSALKELCEAQGRPLPQGCKHL